MSTLFRIIFYPIELLLELAAYATLVGVVFFGIPMFIAAALIQAKRRKMR